MDGDQIPLSMLRAIHTGVLKDLGHIPAEDDYSYIYYKQEKDRLEKFTNEFYN